MFDIPLRRLKDTLTVPLTAAIPPSISPNHLTLLSFVSGLLSCLLAATSPATPLPLTFWLLNRLLDSLDGSVARARGVASELGGFLDLLSDFIIYSLLPIAIAYGQNHPGAGAGMDYLPIAVLEATFHINNFVLFYVAAVARKHDARELTSVAMRPALVEGFESGVLFTAMLVWPGWVGELAWGMGAAVVVGVVQRVWVLVPVLRVLDAGRDGEGEEGRKGD
jgi:phosphatidylglycerophosphate synthase